MPACLYLMRHATAEDAATAPDDALRELVDKGRRQVRDVAGWCVRQGLVPGRLLTSPRLRAQQSADLLARHLPGCPAPEAVDWLQIGTPTATRLARVGALLEPGAPEPWLVGHEPDLSALIAALLHLPQPVLWPRKASLTCLRLPDHAAGPGQLQWHLPCALMGRP